MSRKYTIEEIDRMRNAIDILQWNRRIGFSDPEYQTRLIEERLRTYMFAGTEPDDLVEYVKQQTNMDPDGFKPK